VVVSLVWTRNVSTPGKHTRCCYLLYTDYNLIVQDMFQSMEGFGILHTSNNSDSCSCFISIRSEQLSEQLVVLGPCVTCVVVWMTASQYFTPISKMIIIFKYVYTLKQKVFSICWD
jgi:hypothetical protein